MTQACKSFAGPLLIGFDLMINNVRTKTVLIVKMLWIH